MALLGWQVVYGAGAPHEDSVAGVPRDDSGAGVPHGTAGAATGIDEPGMYQEP
jgi:hypothetical protein